MDVVKTPYCGDVQAYAQIVADCPVPLGCRRRSEGGIRCRAALEMMAQVMRGGARGATIGRNIWGFRQIGAAVQAFKAVIHDGKSADEARCSKPVWPVDVSDRMLASAATILISARTEGIASKGIRVR